MRNNREIQVVEEIQILASENARKRLRRAALLFDCSCDPNIPYVRVVFVSMTFTIP